MKLFYLKIINVLIFLISNNNAFSEDIKKEEKKTEAKVENKDPKKIENEKVETKKTASDKDEKGKSTNKEKVYISKSYFLPKLYNEFSNEKFKKYRFSLVALVGTWNPNSTAVFNWLNLIYNDFKNKNIEIFAVFSHETKESFDLWKTQYKPEYTFGMASSDFIQKLNNPRVPTVWIMKNDGQIMHRKELPKSSDLQKIKDDLLDWTDF